MGLIGSIGLFISLVLILSVLRVRLVFELTGTSLLLFGTTKPGIFFYSLLVLPGTIIHELSHWLVAEILQVKTGEIVILPDLRGSGDEKSLGSVATTRTDPFRGFLIGIAPFLTGLGILAVLGQLLFAAWNQGFPWWQIAILIYGIMVVGNSMMLSRSDRRTWPFIVLLFLLLAFLFLRLNLAISAKISALTLNIFSSLNLVLLVTAIFNLVMIGGSFGVRRLIEKLTQRRIIHKTKEKYL